MRYRVDIVAPDGYIHCAAFNELRDGLVGALTDLGAFDPNGRPIVLGAHTDQRFIVRDAIIFQTEVAGSAWFSPEYKALLAAHEVWDYSQSNIAKLAWQSIAAKHCPIGYHESLTRIELAEHQDIDVLFYGSMTPRRIPTWESICQTKLNCVHLFGIYGLERDAFIARSKIVLNLHAYPTSPREDVRLSYLWANRAFTLSEIPVGPTGPVIPFEYSAAQLPASCEEWRARSSDRAFFAGAVHDSFKLQRQTDYLTPLLAAEQAAA